jgi:hypothetical protein
MDDEDILTEQLLAERNLVGRASILQTAVARAAARALTDASPSSATAAANLLSQLPAAAPRGSEPDVPPGPPKNFDMSVLGDGEIELLTQITLHATGGTPSDGFSHRATTAINLAHLLDQALPGPMPTNVWPGTVVDIAEPDSDAVRSLLHQLTYPLTRERLYPGRVEILAPDGGRTRDLLARVEWLEEELRTAQAVVRDLEQMARGRMTLPQARALVAQLEAPTITPSIR